MVLTLKLVNVAKIIGCALDMTLTANPAGPAMDFSKTFITFRSAPGIEPGTSCTRSRNHTSRPSGQTRTSLTNTAYITSQQQNHIYTHLSWSQSYPTLQNELLISHFTLYILPVQPQSTKYSSHMHHPLHREALIDSGWWVDGCSCIKMTMDSYVQ